MRVFYRLGGFSLKMRLKLTEVNAFLILVRVEIGAVFIRGQKKRRIKIGPIEP